MRKITGFYIVKQKIQEHYEKSSLNLTFFSSLITAFPTVSKSEVNFMQLSTMQNHWSFGHKSTYFLPQNSKKQKAGQNKLESPTSKSPVKHVMKGTNLKPFVVTINPTPHFYKPITEKISMHSVLLAGIEFLNSQRV